MSYTTVTKIVSYLQNISFDALIAKYVIYCSYSLFIAEKNKNKS